jgi:hypothetical protein
VLCRVHFASDATIVSVSGTFRASAGDDELLARFGRISGLSAIRYWSTTDHAWRPLITAAAALTDGVAGTVRADFSAAELATGRSVYLSQTDGRSAQPVTYKMRLRERHLGGFQIEIVNTTALRWWGLTLCKPGELTSNYLLEQQSPGIWTYLAVTTIGGPRWLTAGHENSVVNRAAAFYRHFVGLPDDLEPPAAP